MTALGNKIYIIVTTPPSDMRLTLRDIFILLTLIAAAIACTVIGILALIPHAPFDGRRWVPGIVLLIIAAACIVAAVVFYTTETTRIRTVTTHTLPR